MEKSIIVVSDFAQSGKTTLVEKLVGQKLVWEDSQIQGKIKISRSQFCYNGTNLVFTEVGALMGSEKETWPEVIQMLKEADLILYVHPSFDKKVLNCFDDFFEEMDYKLFEDEIKPKRFVVFTFKNTKPAEVVWYENLTDEEREKFESKWTAENGPGRTFIDGWMYDFNLCLGLWLSTNLNDSEDLFETDIKPEDQGFDILRQRMVEFLGI